MTKRLTEDDFEEMLELKRHMDNADPRTNWVGRMAGYQEAAGKMAPLLVEELRELRAFKATMLEAFRDGAFFHRRADSEEHTRWESEDDARSEAEAEIEAALDPDSGWSEGVADVSHGVLLYLSRAAEMNHRPAPEGSEFAEYCDVVLRDEPYAGAVLRAIDEAYGKKP